jgi:hypothetical protein
MRDKLIKEKPSTPSLKDKNSFLRYARYFWRDIFLIAVFFASMWVMELLRSVDKVPPL